ncbi:MAG: DUF167 domain-containing protein [Patescibacteria group bacterium]
MYIKVKVTAGAKKESYAKLGEDSFRIRVKEPAVRNLANERVLAIIAEQLKLNNRLLKIISGHRSPSKIISIRD